MKTAIFPKTQVQLCIVHMVRNSVAFVSWQHRKQICADLKAIYSAAAESDAEFNLELLAEKWDKQYPSISKSWRSHWANIIPFFAFPPEIRRAIYTTKALESMNSSLRKVIKSQQIFPTDDAVFKLVYLAMRNISWHGAVESALRFLSPIKQHQSQCFQNYLRKHHQRLPDYQLYQQLGLPIGSGKVESTIKQIGFRVKLAGASWSQRNVPKIL
ncbi:MAG: transposase, partial [Pseudanabaena sp.]